MYTDCVSIWYSSLSLLRVLIVYEKCIFLKLLLYNLMYLLKCIIVGFETQKNIIPVKLELTLDQLRKSLKELCIEILGCKLFGKGVLFY